LIQRVDDAPETVKDRLRIYHEQSEPLKGFYERLGRLRTIVGTGTVEEINRRVMEVFG
jgi:adenylate kinase